MPVWKCVVWGRKHNLSFMEFLCGARLRWCKGSLEMSSDELRGWGSIISEMLPKVASSGLVTHGQAAALRALGGSLDGQSAAPVLFPTPHCAQAGGGSSALFGSVTSCLLGLAWFSFHSLGCS